MHRGNANLDRPPDTALAVGRELGVIVQPVPHARDAGDGLAVCQAGLPTGVDVVAGVEVEEVSALGGDVVGGCSDGRGSAAAGGGEDVPSSEAVAFEIAILDG